MIAKLKRLADKETYPDEEVMVTETIGLSEVKKTIHMWKEAIQAELNSLVEKEAIVRIKPHMVEALIASQPDAKIFLEKEFLR